MSRSLTKSLLTAVLMISGVGGTMVSPAMAADHIEQQIYRDGQFGRIAEKIRTDLRRQGYYVMTIKADDYKGKPAVKVYAKKNNRAYEAKYSYPDLKLLESKQKPWSQLWQDDHQPDIEDKIKSTILADDNFELIKKKAAQKLEKMGYVIDEIEVDDYQQKAILKADVDRGDKEYEVRLSYPDLDILTIEED